MFETKERYLLKSNSTWIHCYSTILLLYWLQELQLNHLHNISGSPRRCSQTLLLQPNLFLSVLFSILFQLDIAPSASFGWVVLSCIVFLLSSWTLGLGSKDHNIITKGQAAKIVSTTLLKRKKEVHTKLEMLTCMNISGALSSSCSLTILTFLGTVLIICCINMSLCFLKWKTLRYV